MPLKDSRNKTAPYCKSNWLLPLTDWLELLQAATWNIIWAYDLPPKVKNKVAKTFFRAAVWEDKGEKNEKVTKLEPQALEMQSAITDFFWVMTACSAKHFNLCLFCAFRCCRDSDSAELQLNPRCGRGRRWQIRLPQGRQVSVERIGSVS